PGAERNDQSDLLGDRNEFSGAVPAEVLVLPSQQRLERDEGAILCTDPRLVVDIERHRLDGAAETVLQPPALVRLLLHGGVVQREAISAVLLGAMQRRVAAAEHRLDRVAVRGKPRDADAGR